MKTVHVSGGGKEKEMTETETEEPVRVTISGLPKTLDDQLENLARNEGRSKSGQIVYIIKKALAKEETE